MPIARQLAHALGGELKLETEVGKGSRFELRLPARRGTYAPGLRSMR